MVRYSWTKAWLPACCVRGAGHNHINENNIRRICEGLHLGINDEIGKWGSKLRKCRLTCCRLVEG